MYGAANRVLLHACLMVQKGGAEVHDCKKAGGRCENASGCRALKYTKLLAARPGLIDALHKERRAGKE